MYIPSRVGSPVGSKAAHGVSLDDDEIIDDDDDDAQERGASFPSLIEKRHSHGSNIASVGRQDYNKCIISKEFRSTSTAMDLLEVRVSGI